VGAKDGAGPLLMSRRELLNFGRKIKVNFPKTSKKSVNSRFFFFVYKQLFFVFAFFELAKNDFPFPAENRAWRNVAQFI